MELFCRLELHLGQQALAFAPDRLPDETLAGTTLKRAMASALFTDFKALGSDVAKILWEVAVSHDPPACIKPLKPKLWLVNKLEMEVDTLYKVI